MTRLGGVEKSTGIFAHKGFDYGPFLTPGMRVYLENELHLDLFRMSQALKLMRAWQFDMMVVTGDIAPMYAVMARAKSMGCQSVYMDHGINQAVCGLRDAHLNHTDTIYVTSGTDHLESYGPGLPDPLKPERPILGNPATTEMAAVCGKRRRSGEPRILLTGLYTQICELQWQAYFTHDRYSLISNRTPKSDPTGYGLPTAVSGEQRL